MWVCYIGVSPPSISSPIGIHKDCNSISLVKGQEIRHCGQDKVILGCAKHPCCRLVDPHDKAMVFMGSDFLTQHKQTQCALPFSIGLQWFSVGQNENITTTMSIHESYQPYIHTYCSCSHHQTIHPSIVSSI